MDGKEIMKIILKNKKVSNVEFQANKIFTDREVPRQSFWRTYKAYKDTLEVGEDIKVLTYYGIGGIGKTSLLHKLRDEMKEKIKKPLYAYIDLNISREPRVVLDSLRNMLSADDKFEFPLYDLAVYAYAKKIGEKINEETTEGLIGRSRFLSTVMDALSDIPLVGIVSKLDKCAGYVRDFIVHYKNETTDIGESTPEEIYKKLPYYFACDITDNLQSTTEPLVIFLDTYETLVNEMSGTGEAIDNDLWIRGEDGLVMNSQRVLWVIAGREKLRWTDINDEWEESLDQHILGSLSKSDAFMFLKMSGINEENLLEAIYKLTNGTPVFLDLCVDNYSKIISLGHTPTIEDFSGSTNALISRYLKYMDDGLKDIVFLLSCVKTWNDSLFSNITEKAGANFSFTAYERIKSLSFITDDGNGTYTMQQTVQSVIFQKCPELLKNKTFIALAQYYEKKLDSVSLGNVVDTDLSMIFSKYVDSVLQIPYEKEEDFAKKYSELKGKIDKLRSCIHNNRLSNIRE